MIEYMTNHDKGTIIYQMNHIEIVPHSLIYTIERICEEHLFTYEGYRKAVKNTCKITHRIPIYFCDDLQLIPSERYRNYDACFINYASIEVYEEVDDGILIRFFSGRTLYIKMTLYNLKKAIEKLKKIRNTKVKHFH